MLEDLPLQSSPKRVLPIAISLPVRNPNTNPKRTTPISPMTHLEKQLEQIGAKVNEMWDLVEFQVRSGRQLLTNPDKALAKQALKTGKKVNNYDLKVDVLCKNFLALFNPVAIDLRWVLAILKINANLERIGDSAEGIAYLIKDLKEPVDPALLEELRLTEMYDAVLAMMDDIRQAYKTGNVELANDLILRDEVLNKINHKADKKLERYIQANPERVRQCLKLSGIIRKLERIGDQVTNIAEEVVFYINGTVIKHQNKL